MKPKILIPILAIAALALAVALFVSRRTVGDQSQQISTLSNEWQKASIKVSDLTQVNATLEKDLTKRNTDYLSLTNAYAQALTTLAKTETDLKQTEDSLKLTKEELAALTVALAALLSAPGPATGAGPGSPLWRPEPARGVYRSPYSWQ